MTRQCLAPHQQFQLRQQFTARAAGNPAAGSSDSLTVAEYCHVAHELCLAAAACLDADLPKHSQLPVASLHHLVHAPCRHVADEAVLAVHAHLTAPAVEARQLLLLVGSTADSTAPSSQTYRLPAAQSCCGPGVWAAIKRTCIAYLEHHTCTLTG